MDTLMNTTKRAVLYLRVSTKDQETLNQKQILEEVATQRGWEITSIYEDDGISGDGKKSRQAFNQLLKDTTQGKFDVVMAWDVSRVSRNLSQLITFLNTMSDTNVSVYLHQQNKATESFLIVSNMRNYYKRVENKSKKPRYTKIRRNRVIGAKRITHVYIYITLSFC